MRVTRASTAGQIKATMSDSRVKNFKAIVFMEASSSLVFAKAVHAERISPLLVGGPEREFVASVEEKICNFGHAPQAMKSWRDLTWTPT
jgi:hypothetical protein